MFAVALAFFALGWGLWFTFLVRYPQQWNAQIERLHARLAQHGLSAGWMKSAEKGAALKVIVGGTTFLILVCLAMVLRYPTALSAYLHHA